VLEADVPGSTQHCELRRIQQSEAPALTHSKIAKFFAIQADRPPSGTKFNFVT
jgi:hypothetical protein